MTIVYKNCPSGVNGIIRYSPNILLTASKLRVCRGVFLFGL